MSKKLLAAIEAFNEHSRPAITLLTTRDGRVVATLPRLQREVVVGETDLNKKVKVSAQDLAAVCEEARLASAPALALLDTALGILRRSAAA